MINNKNRVIRNFKPSSFQSVVANFTGNVRHDTMGGRDYLVAPMIMLVESVANGLSGPLLYSANEISKNPSAWNSKPVVVYHPEQNGQGISACDPDVLTNRGVGVIMNTKWEDGKLKAEAWIEVDRANKVDGRIMNAIESNSTMELSTGLMLEEELTPGEFNGKSYTGIARNFQPDHLALLPDQVGACSVEDGAGFLRLNHSKGDKKLFIDITTMSDGAQKFITSNELIIGRYLAKMINNEMSHENIRSLLGSALQSASSDDRMLWVEEVFDDFFIYEDEGKLYKQGYEIKAGEIGLTGERTEVVRITEFRTKDGKFIGNCRKDKLMDKIKLIDGLIANVRTQFAETDRTMLEAMDETTLAKLSPVLNEEEVVAEAAAEAAESITAHAAQASAAAQAAPASEATADVDAAAAAEATKAEAVPAMNALDKYLDNAPPEIASVLKNAMKVTNDQKAAMVTVIVSNKKNTFTKEFLMTKDLEELTNIAALAGDVVAQNAAPVHRFNYIGQGDPANVSNTAKGGTLGLPKVVG